MAPLTESQQEWLKSARAMLDFLESKPELIPRYSGLDAYADVNTAGELAEKLRILGTADKYASEQFIGARRKFGEHKVVVTHYRSQVCERIEVGTEEVELEVPADRIPDDAEVIGDVEPERRVLVRRTVPKFEVRCPDSLLAGSPS